MMLRAASSPDANGRFCSRIFRQPGCACFTYQTQPLPITIQGTSFTSSWTWCSHDRADEQIDQSHEPTNRDQGSERVTRNVFNAWQLATASYDHIQSTPTSVTLLLLDGDETDYAHTSTAASPNLALFLMTALSALGASLMFLSQTETYASMNYRMMSQGPMRRSRHPKRRLPAHGTQYAVPVRAEPTAKQLRPQRVPVKYPAVNERRVLSANTGVGIHYRSPRYRTFVMRRKGRWPPATQPHVQRDRDAQAMQLFESYAASKVSCRRGRSRHAHPAAAPHRASQLMIETPRCRPTPSRICNR